MTAHHFTIDSSRCVHCGRCASDCVASAIDMRDGVPLLARPDDCVGCQHCLAVCPAAALSIFGKKPEDSLPNTGLPDPESLRRLFQLRRSHRHFKQEDIPPALFRDLLETAWYAPTGVNRQGVHLAVMATRKAMDGLRAKVYAALERQLNRPGRQESEYDPVLRDQLGKWNKDGIDNIFRSAPHMVIASVSPETVCAEADPMIVLSYLDIYAQAKGVGTVWCGFAMHAFGFCADESLWREAGVPEGYRPAYAMMLGMPALSYPRSVQRGPAAVRMVGLE